jgi:hypothetical protein
MRPFFDDGNVKTFCPDCGAITTFEFQTHGSEFGGITIQKSHNYKGTGFPILVYKLLRCAGCNRGGLAKLHLINQYKSAILEDFYPFSIEKVAIPDNIPEGIQNEFREAEICASVNAWRAASAMLRSTLEKTLKINGYTSGNLKSKIDVACDDGVITAARKQKAHDDVRVLGNDILHEEWREVSFDEYEAAHHYTQRILEDFYDDRPSVEALLKKANRIQ